MQKEAWRNLPKYSARLGEQAAVAEQLYDVLADPAVTRRRLPVLLAANKADCGARAHTPDFIRKRLEKALGELRGTRAALASDETGAGARVGPLLVLPGLCLCSSPCITLLTGAQACRPSMSSPCPGVVPCRVPLLFLCLSLQWHPRCPDIPQEDVTSSCVPSGCSPGSP